MRAYEVILKKRNGGTLSEAEIQFMINGFTKGTIPDYQMSAFCMAVFFQGMEPAEIASLTMAMANSGDVLDLSAIEGRKIDKHSTGGVGDTTTLVLGPLVASCGVPVAKMSGRGLGHTGGTIDKLESIAGFQVSLSESEFISQVNSVKLSVVGQTGELAPADKKLYALRDVTATVDTIPLIASSIMSKKIAAGADGFVLDVKTGKGAFMQKLEDSIELAKTMVAIGTEVGKDTVALVTDMNQPLGLAIGNSLEVKEAILTLQNQGPADLKELCIILGAEMLILAGRCDSEQKARALLEEKLANGEALDKFAQLILAQGGDPEVTQNLSLLPQAKFIHRVSARSHGYVESIDSLEIGLTAMGLGAGRETQDSVIDLAVGIELQKKVGDAIGPNDCIAIIHSNKENLIAEAEQRIRQAYTFSAAPVAAPNLLWKKITKQDV